jgi:hypothetical protein
MLSSKVRSPQPAGKRERGGESKRRGERGRESKRREEWREVKGCEGERREERNKLRKSKETGSGGENLKKRPAFELFLKDIWRV